MINEPPLLIRLSAAISAAYLSNNKVSIATVPVLIEDVYQTLRELGRQRKSHSVNKVSRVPAVPPKESVFYDYIFCLEDGQKLSMLKGHLKQKHNLTPHEYRRRWGLPSTYPIVAPAYARRRSVISRDLKRRQQEDR